MRISDEPISAVVSDDSETESGMESGMTSVPNSSERYLPTNGGGPTIDFDDLTDRPSLLSNIHFDGASSPATGESSGSDDEGITQNEVWRPFQQSVDALVHMPTFSIPHRDIKLTNIFIDAKGDCKVGDSGFATSSLAAVDPSDVSPQAIATEDMTLHAAIMANLSLLSIVDAIRYQKSGQVVFFEMNYTFATGARAERIAVIEDPRKPGIFFPSAWDPLRHRQREIIAWLLQRQPEDRPTASELSQSSLLPSRIEDEYFKGALNLMTKANAPHQQAVLNSLFSQPPRPSRGFIYDLEVELPEYAALNDIVQDRLAAIFRLHGAVDMEPPLLMPVMDVEDEHQKAILRDRNGDIVTLPANLIVPFARLAAQGNISVSNDIILLIFSDQSKWKRKADGHRFLLLFSVRDERVQLLNLSHNVRDGFN
ncbi:hypothetical protein DXG01_011485 [Tephrocybe rancida]|nr:hypothetical protein DXG01_011485 [Tephrocybe rancida]